MTISIKHVMLCLATLIITALPLSAMGKSIEIEQLDKQEEIDSNDAKPSNLVVINQETGITSCGTIEQKIVELNMQINLLKQTPLDQKRRIIKDLEDVVGLLKKTLALSAMVIIFIEGRRVLIKICEMGCMAYDIWLKSQNFNYSMTKAERIFAFLKSVAGPVIEFVTEGFAKKLWGVFTNSANKSAGVFIQTPENSLLRS